MPDLHGWITQQIDRVEATARGAEKEDGRDWTSHWDEQADAFQIRDGLGILVADQLQPCAAGLVTEHDPAAVLRRCEAGRRILNRHRLDPAVHWTPACAGCGDYGDQEMPYTENLNECPELLDLAYAHGLTSEVLASLDQPETPPRPERPDIPPPVHLNALIRLLSAQPTSSVPPALRGPNWKAQP